MHEGQHGETEGKGISEGVGFEGTDVEVCGFVQGYIDVDVDTHR